MAGTTVVRVERVSKRFVIHKDKSLKERVVNAGRSRRHRDDFWALRDVDLEIGAGSTVGLVGANGSGKSTLLKIVGGILQPSQGQVLLRGRLAALLELGAGFHPDLTGRENVFLNASILGLSRSFTERSFDAIVDFSGIEPFIDTQVKFYSSGMYVRLAFAVAVHVDPDILLVDEVLAVGDATFQRKCLERIGQFQAEGRTIILVSHSLGQVQEFCDRVVVLEHGRIAADSTPDDALMTLRTELEQVRIDELAKAATAERPLPQARFAGVAVSSDDDPGELQPQLHSGGGLAVVMEIEAEDELRDWSLEIGITTPIGTLLFSTSTGLLGIELAPLRGTGRYRLVIDRLDLGTGDYAVHVTLRDSHGVDVHDVPVAARFSVVADDVSQGPLRLPVAFETL